MSQDLVLVTGASGFIATHVIKQLLETGYNVRGTVRRPEQGQQLKDLFSSFGLKFEFVIVPDMLAPGAYNGVLDGVTYMIHVASPLAKETTEYERDIIKPATLGTKNALEATLRIPNLKRFVVTSSIATLFPPKGADLFALSTRTDHKLSEKDVQDTPKDMPIDNYLEAYFLSKILADRAVFAFIEAHPEVSFDVVSIHPSTVFGRNLLQTSHSEISGTNSLLWGILTQGFSFPMIFGNVHIDDVARSHVLALDKSKIPGGERYLIAAPQSSWANSLEYAKKQWPERKWAEQETSSITLKLNTSKAEEAFGLKWIPFERQIDDVVEQMIALGA